MMGSENIFKTHENSIISIIINSIIYVFFCPNMLKYASMHAVPRKIIYFLSESVEPKRTRDVCIQA